MATPERLPKGGFVEQFKLLVKRWVLPHAGALDDGVLLEERRKREGDETIFSPSELEYRRSPSAAENTIRIAIERHGPDAHDGI